MRRATPPNEATVIENTRQALVRRGLFLEYVTLGWNVVGSVIVIVAALACRCSTIPSGLTVQRKCPLWRRSS